MRDTLIGGGHQASPDKITDIGILRRRYLCLDHRGRRATAMRCQNCESRCGYGERYLDLLGIPYKKHGRTDTGDMLHDDPMLTLRQRFRRMRVKNLMGGND